jgi:AcrR family transcriptional regulator
MAKRGSSASAGKPNLRPPTQSRSRESTEALLEIGRRMIEERGIDECNMSDVAAAAGSSIGSLYFRFGNKEKFVREVMQRQVDASSEQLARALVEIEAKAATPADVIEAATGFVVRQYIENRGLLRAQLRRSLESPGEWQPIQGAGQDIVGSVIRLVDRFPEVQTDPDWQRRVRIAMQIVFGTLNNILVDRPGPLDLSDSSTAQELSLAAIRYLRWDGKPETTQVGSLNRAAANRSENPTARKPSVARRTSNSPK